MFQLWYEWNRRLSTLGEHMCCSVHLSGKRGRSGFFYAEGKSLVFPLKRFHSSKSFPSLPGSKLTCLSDLVIPRLRPAPLPTQRIFSL